MRKLLVARPLKETLQQKIRLLLPNWEIVYTHSTEEFESHLHNAEIIAGWRHTNKQELLHENRQLRWIQTWSAGINYLPLPLLEKKEISLTNATGIHAYPISETIFAILLSFTRKLPTYLKQQQNKIWHHADLNLELHDKTIAILGIGAIGKETAKIAKAFNMKVIGFRSKLEPYIYVDEMYTLEQLDEQLPYCDYVVVTLPLTDKTKHLFTAKQFDLMKDTSFFVNIGRGPITVEEDLIHALQTNKIAGAGLDVFDVEPLPPSHPFWELENCIITPHTAGNSSKYDERIVEDIFLPNLKNYLDASSLIINVIDYKRGY